MPMREVSNQWVKARNKFPDVSGIYLVMLSDKRVKAMGFTTSLSNLEPNNFIKEKDDRAGWYMDDPEYGLFEVRNVVYWTSLPDPPEVRDNAVD